MSDLERAGMQKSTAGVWVPTLVSIPHPKSKNCSGQIEPPLCESSGMIPCTRVTTANDKLM